MATSSKKRASTQAKSYSRSKSKTNASTMKQPAQHDPQAALMGAPPTPAFNYQPHNFLGSQTISRSNNLHKQFYAQAQAAANRCSIYQPAGVPPTSYLYYEQPTSGYQVPHHQLYAPAGQAHTLHRYSYAPMSLALRAPRDRCSIPMPMLQQAVYQQPLSQPKNGVKRAESEDSTKPPAAAAKMIYQEPKFNLMRSLEHQARLNKPLCRCRVMYLGSSVPHITKNGLHGIQEPLRHLYPEEQFNSANLRHGQKMVPPTSGDSNSSHYALSQTIDISHLSSTLGIDSWLSVWSNGLLLENVDEFGRDVRRFYSIESLHYCAAVRFFDTATLMQGTSQSASSAGLEPDANNNQQPRCGKQQEALAAQMGAGRRGVVRFLPLDAPIFQYPGMLDANHPPVFAAIMRRTSGIKVLECHAFICRRDAASNALVRCCTHAYSDFLSAKRLSADFGFLQQQQASAYLGPTSMTVDGELLARGQTMPPSHARPRLHPTSGGHFGANSRAPLDAGQYQVIEALMKQSYQQESSTGSHKSNSQKRHSGRHANSTGTNSNELTHTESLNSADESEPENNYAIIPKSSSTLNNSAAPSRDVAPSRHRASRERSSRRRSRKIKGSSKSLFKDFMPPPVELKRQSAHELEIEKLSHSLDYLTMLSSQQPIVGGPGRGDAAAQKSDYDEPSQQFGAQSDIFYSLVNTKSKRHSKSMQNLVQQPHQASPANSIDRQQLGGTVGSRLPASHRKGPANRDQRKSASFQDLLAQQQQLLEAPPLAATPSSFASMSRCSSVRSSAASRSQRVRRSAANSQLDQNESQQQRHEQGEERRSSLAASSEGHNARIYATCDNQNQERPRVLRADCCTSKSASRSRSRSESSKRRSKRSDQDQEMLPPEQSLGAEQHHLGYSLLPPVPLQGLYSPLGPGPQQAIYMPPGSFYGQPGGAPLYSSKSLYDNLTPPPGPFMPLPYVHSQYQHPQQQQLFFSPAPSLTQPRHMQSATDYAMPSALDNALDCSKAKGRSKSKSRSATLATRFRCLSPPLSFFSSPTQQPADVQPQQPLAGPQNSRQGSERVSTTNIMEQQRAPLDSLTAEGARDEVVSAQPGFMSSRGEESPTTLASRKQKLSWIKRLSISLSSGGSASQAGARALSAAAQVARSDPQPISAFERAPLGVDSDREVGQSGELLDSVPEGSRPDERLNVEAGGAPDDQSSADQQLARPPNESAGHQVDGLPQQQQTSEQRPADETKKSKRKRAGLFSGALTLGRSSGQKRGQSSKIVT